MISICLATYNGEKYILEQLNSILPYLDKYDEVLISDDNSTDRTVSIIKNLNDPRIILFFNDFRNSTLNFEFLIRKANGDKIFLCDQDDIWLPDKISKITQILDNNYYDLVLTDCDIINNKNEVIKDSFFISNNSKKGFINNLIKNSYMGCCMAFNRNIIPYILPFPNNISNYKVVHDYWIGMSCEFFFNIYFLDEVLIHHRKHNKNASNTSSGISNLNLTKRIILRYLLLYSIFKTHLKLNYKL